MRKCVKNKMLVFLGFFMALGSIGQKSQTIKAAPSADPYEIYPVPQNIDYPEGTLDLSTSPEINVVIEKALDTPTQQKIQKVLQAQNLNYAYSDTIQANKTNILLGINGSQGPVDTYFKETLKLQNNFDKIDAYQLAIHKQNIAILGKNTDATFYGIITLNAILNQRQNNTLKNVTINDYANTSIRGVIEGYYGIPWGNENRADLIRFGEQFKMNAFVFAPKDDPYHRERWRDLYPENELAEIKKLAALGNETKNRYVWTIAPFKPNSNPITATNVKQATTILINKFEQLYAAGVRQFGVLGDDVGALPMETVVTVMQSVSKWAQAKGDIYDVLFVPQGYVLASWGFNAKELNLYDAGFPANIHIMFTGENTMSRLNQKAIDDFKNKQANGKPRRDPLFWMNWPVNDIDRSTYRRLFMGKGEMYQVGVQNMIGVLTNPMEESQPSKTALFATADYAWNNNAFNADKSWRDSFKYIEPNVPQALQEIAKHMSSMDHGGIGNLEESVELNVLVKAYTQAIKSQDTATILKATTQLKTAYQNIVEAVQTFETKTKQTQLFNEMKPYVYNLKFKAQALIEYLQALEAMQTPNSTATKERIQKNIDTAQAHLIEARKQTVTTKTAEFPTKTLQAESGMLVINPNLKTIEKAAKDMFATWNSDQSKI